MPYIITRIHNPRALAAVCHSANLPAPREGCVALDDLEASGWVVRLPGVRFPIVCDTLTGRVAYHPRDNAFEPYGRIMRYLRRGYDEQARLRQGEADSGAHPYARRARRLLAGVGRP